MTEFAKRGRIHASNFANLTSHNFICKQAIKLKFSEGAKRGRIHASNFQNLTSHNFICKQAIKLKFSEGLPPNFRAVGPTEAELHII